jgi:hypothetical protein
MRQQMRRYGERRPVRYLALWTLAIFLCLLAVNSVGFRHFGEALTEALMGALIFALSVGLVLTCARRKARRQLR